MTPYQVSLIGEMELPRDRRSPRAARAAVGAWLGEDHPAGYNARLVVSELVTNSVLYADGSSAVRLRLYDFGRHIRVEVEDSGIRCAIPLLGVPQSDVENPAKEGGRGLFIVESVSDCWGIEILRDPAGCIVWSHIPLQE
ncbi:ATP-binding protein [Sphaerisporangium sp. NPDC051017]|uniref:ATP-binding protein n=1 Tax=Sphaerisporangium sp. NPDC051017 TaxID=3154636 RepID=UPI003437DCED